MKHLLMILTLSLFVVLPVEAQEATITIDGYAYGQITGIGHDCPIRANGRIEGYVGMVVTCEVWAVDTAGSFTPASMSAVSADSTRVRVTVSTLAMDSLGNHVPSSMMIEVLRRGNWHVTIDANPILFIMGYMHERPVDAFWPQIEGLDGEIKALVGEDFLLCAYQGGYDTKATAKSLERPIPCPDQGTGPLPEFEVTWILPDILTRVADATPNQMMAGVKDGSIRPKWIENTRHAVPLKGQ